VSDSLPISTRIEPRRRSGEEEGGGFSLAGLASIRCHDEYTFNHMVNVCVLAIAFGRRLGLRRTQTAQLGLCALYHDLGKLHVPLEILNKRSRLSEEEWACLGNHTIYAARTLFPLVASSLDTIPRIRTALQHHLRYDGRGYPRLRVLRRQSLYARITAVVDAFDAMTTLRVYQSARLPHEALREIQAGSGTHDDPLLVRCFVNCMGVYPIGSAVRLRNGDVAVVCESHPDPERVHQPKVKVVLRGGVPLAEPQLLDLAEPGAEGLQVRECVDPEPLGINPAHYLL
jgi:HD-GYP domain-containing protein (c-di-GMP phosphodiesterase class II)